MTPSPAPAVPASPLHSYDSVWIHGAGFAGDTWSAMTAALPRARTPDLPGHGAARPVVPPRVERFADRLAPEIGAGAILIGHSLGGMVALELAARRAGPVSALILIDSVPTVRDRLGGRLLGKIAEPVVHLLGPRGLAWISGVGQAIPVKQELQRQLLRHDNRSLLAAIDAAMAYDGRPLLSGIHVPTLIIVAQNSKATHAGSRLMARRIPRAEHAVLSGGHILHVDSPVRLRRRIDEFLRHKLPENQFDR
ncbi:MAG: alpha/beta hydrolase [Pseudomonadota bacterium]